MSTLFVKAISKQQAVCLKYTAVVDKIMSMCMLVKSY